MTLDNAHETAAEPVQLTYDHALSARPGVWRGILAILLLLVGFGIASLVFGGIAIVVDLALGAMTLDSLAAGEITFTPTLMLANNLSLAVLIPISFGVQRLMFGVRPGTLSSVAGRFRWRWFGRLAIVIVPVWLVYVGLSFLLEPFGEAPAIDGAVLAMLAVVVLTQPLQSAGEEYGARGLIQRSAGSWFRNPVPAFIVGTLVSGALFSAAHFAADPWLIVYYFVFAASASLSARVSGGLEAPVLVHVVNNLLLLVPTVLYGQIEQSFERGEGAGGPFMLIPMALCVGVVFFTRWWARRSGVQVTAPGPQPVRAEVAAHPAPPHPVP